MLLPKRRYIASEVGALASNGTAVNASKVNNALTLQIAGTTKNTFDGSSAQTFNIPNASTSSAGVMTTAQVTKLNGIATGATKNTIDTAMSSTSTNAVQNKVIYAYIQEQINNLANGGISVIKSIQRGTSIIESGDYYREITINPVNVNKAMVNYLGFTGSSNDTSSDHKYRGYLKLVDSTTLTIRRADADGSDYTFSWEVIEFNQGVDIMFLYAQLNDNGYCISISDLSGEVIDEKMIPITDFDDSYLCRKYDITNKSWTDEYLEKNNDEYTEITPSEVEELQEQINDLQDIVMTLANTICLQEMM